MFWNKNLPSAGPIWGELGQVEMITGERGTAGGFKTSRGWQQPQHRATADSTWAQKENVWPPELLFGMGFCW